MNCPRPQRAKTVLALRLWIFVHLFIPSLGSSELSFWLWENCLPWEVSRAERVPSESRQHKRKTMTKSTWVFFVFISHLNGNYSAETNANTKCSCRRAFVTYLLRMLSTLRSWQHSSCSISVLFLTFLACCLLDHNLGPVPHTDCAVSCADSAQGPLPWAASQEQPSTQNRGDYHHFRTESRMFTWKCHCTQHDQI